MQLASRATAPHAPCWLHEGSRPEHKTPCTPAIPLVTICVCPEFRHGAGGLSVGLGRLPCESGAAAAVGRRVAHTGLGQQSGGDREGGSAGRAAQVRPQAAATAAASTRRRRTVRS